MIEKAFNCDFACLKANHHTRSGYPPAGDNSGPPHEHKYKTNRISYQREGQNKGLRTNNQKDASSIQNFILSRNSTYFRHLLCPSSWSYQLYTWQLVCFMWVMWSLPRRVRLEPESPRQRTHNLNETYQMPRVQLITPDGGHRRCPKYVEFRDYIKFWILDAFCWLFIRRLSRCTVT